MRFFLPLFLILPIIEIILLIKVGQQVGVLATLGLLFFMGVAGMFLLRHQGLSTLMRVNERMQQGDLPAQDIVGGMVIAIGALLLVIPGFFTDFLAFFCLMPPTRYVMVRRLLKHGRFMAGYNARPPFYTHPSPGDVIDVEFSRDDKRRLDKP